MPRKVFVAGEILTAADVNTNLMDQAVMVFDDATDRATAIPTPVEGMVTYLKDEDEVTVFDGSAFKAVGPGKILQVVSTAKTDTFSTTSTSNVDVTGLSATITPSATSNKVLILVQTLLGNANAATTSLQLVRGSTEIAKAVGGASQHTQTAFGGAGYGNPASVSFLDSPATASATTYKMQASVASGTGFVGRAGTLDRRAISTITLMEVAG